MSALADNPVIIEALRTPIGTTGGVFADQTTTDLAAPVLGELDARLPAGTGFSEVVLGNVRGPGGDPARVAALAAGIDPAVPALTLDRQCGSGMAAIEYAWHRCRSQPGVVAAGGMQAASTQPITLWPGRDGEPPTAFDRAPFAPPPWLDLDMGVMADQLAAELHISRERQDRYALRSHMRAATARDAGDFDAEIVPIAGVGRDQRPRGDFTMARLARFPAAFRPGGTVTAANSCGINDAAAAVTMVAPGCACWPPAPSATTPTGSAWASCRPCAPPSTTPDWVSTRSTPWNSTRPSPPRCWPAPTHSISTSTACAPRVGPLPWAIRGVRPARSCWCGCSAGSCARARDAMGWPRSRSAAARAAPWWSKRCTPAGIDARAARHASRSRPPLLPRPRMPDATRHSHTPPISRYPPYLCGHFG
ncbi:Acetyl-CoA C-acetyltransferase vraB [Propionibacterium freudenreichii]|nr:Acetyl-CoA C-acetyltransferase vraB [Propionibacterium freudenreichii]